MADWYILSDIPYQKDFPPLIRITREPGTSPWHIKTDIPYMPEFPALQAISDKPHTWYINTDIPYIKSFPVLVPLNDEPGIKSWYIKDDIPYMKEFPKLYKVNASPLLPWYILNDIPYQKPFPELVAINAAPSSGWYILDDIPYQKDFPELIPINAKPSSGWYILDDIPYMKQFPPLIPIDDKPSTGWYILHDIPYMKEFPPLYPIEPIPIPHYMYYFTVGVASVGRWQVRKTRLKANMPPPEEWTLIEDLGPPSAVLSACIEADGDFDYIAGNDSITLTTTDTPWMAVITTTKKLYVKQVCADITTAILLDTGVEQASLCRGWKSDKYSVDSGLICAYRKANGVFAKVYKKVNGEYVWETLPQLLYEPVDHVEVKRLNDYRIGVYVTNPNRLLLSERFYIGGTSKTEYVSLQLTNDFTVLGCAKATEVRDFKVVSTTLVAPDTIKVQGNFPFYKNDPTWLDITLTTGLIDNGLSNYYIENGYLFLKLRNRLTTAVAPLTFKIRAINRIQYECTPSCRPVVPALTFEFKPDTLPTERVALSTAFNLHPITVTEMKHLQAKSEEHVNLNTQFTLHPITLTPITHLKAVNTEQVSLAVGMSLHPITITQSGDTPI